MESHIEQAIERVRGQRPDRLTALGGGCIGDVYKVGMPDGTTIIAKTSRSGGLQLEGRMLAYLGERSPLPVPEVLHSDDALLLMSLLPGSGSLNDAGEIEAADLVAALHDITADAFGFEYDTVIGGLHQPNPQSVKWLPFFAEHRLIYMGRHAMESGRLPSPLMARLEHFAERIDTWLGEPKAPSLIHGDMWGGNVIANGGHLGGFIDPALYFADAEIELAFTTLFGTFSNTFFDRYQEHRPLQPGFFDERRDIYNLYPLLVHVRLFGGSYVGYVDRTLARFGF